MKNFFAIAIMATMFIIPVKGQQLIGSYSYNTGNLVGQNGWTNAVIDRTSAPVQVTSETLTHPSGYGVDEKVIAIPYGSSASNQRCFKSFTEQTSGEVWYSLLLRVDNHSAQTNALLGFWNYNSELASGNDNDPALAKNLSAILGIKTLKRTADTVFLMSVSSGGNANYSATTSPFTLDTFMLHQTYLVVVKYKFFGGEKNDSVYWWINPSTSEITTNIAPSPRGSYHQYSGGSSSDDVSGIHSFIILHGCANSSVSALRVAKSWAGLFGLSEPTDQPEITIIPSVVNLDTVWRDSTYTRSVVIRGSNLTSAPLTVTETSQELTIDKTTLDKAKVESANGDTIKITVAAHSLGAQNTTVTYSGGGVSSPVLQDVVWTCIVKSVEPTTPPDTGNLVDNPDFENWANGSPSLQPDELLDWDITLGSVEKKTDTVLNGIYSAKISGWNTSADGYKLEQKISRAAYGGFNAGDTFELTVNYYVTTSQSGNDIKMSSYWVGSSGSGEHLDHDSDVLSSESYFPSLQGQWATKTVRTTVPAGALGFYLRLQITKNSAVYFDNFSFRKVYAAQTPPTPPDPDTSSNVALTVNYSGLNSPYATTIGAPVKDTVYYTAKNLPDYGRITCENTVGSAFTVSNTMIVKNVENAMIIITYNPTVAGTHSATITFKAAGVDSVVINVGGTAVSGAGGDYDTSFKFDGNYAVSHLREDFETSTHNQKLSVPHWQNVVIQGARPWWGYRFNDTAHAAKVTAYVMGQTEEIPYQMWMVTPLLDAVNSETKMLTFDVMAQFIPEEGTTADLQIVYIDPKSDTSFEGTILPFTLPSTNEETDIWFAYHINMAELDNLADTFAIGFRFTGMSGTGNATVYYIDNVTFGEHIPVVSIEQEVVWIRENFATSENINVNAVDLVSDITLELIGDDAGYFSISSNRFPATTTDTFFTATLSVPVLTAEATKNIDTLYAAVLISSEGANEDYVFLAGLAEYGVSTDLRVLHESDMLSVWQNNNTLYFTADKARSYKIIDINGRTVLLGDADNNSVFISVLPKGVYLLQVVTDNGVLNKKFVKVDRR
ncbi:MAG: T9SS type A sorting domain-containing protein [Bacteroidales bacterium]|nr:T9SS type A sorting domain-containing protein [Bacteroidales bacterium]